MITGRQPGADITLVNTLFWRAPKTEDGKINDYLTIVYKDNANGHCFRVSPKNKRRYTYQFFPIIIKGCY